MNQITQKQLEIKKEWKKPLVKTVKNDELKKVIKSSACSEYVPCNFFCK